MGTHPPGRVKAEKKYLYTMPVVLRNILAVLIGWIAGSIINMTLIGVGHTVFPIEGFDPNDRDALVLAMKQFEARHFVFPFLAHALGTFAGALVAAVIAASHKRRMALLIGVLFLLGGSAMAYVLPAPAWFIALDLVLAYLPMAWLASRLVKQSAQVQ